MNLTSRILICGLVRDLQYSIDSEIARLSKSLEQFSEVHYFLVESDSSDLTVRELEKMRNSHINLEFLSLGSLSGEIPDRVERIRYCRNQYVKYIRENLKGFDFVIVADLDGINNKITKSSFESLLNAQVQWDMCAANQTGGYYDIYALRARDWCESDFLIEYEEKGRGLNNRQLFQLRTALIYDRMKRIDRRLPWIAVDSAFGGLAVYKIELFVEADYSAVNESASRQCEHVDLNLKLMNMGYKLFINPALINSHWNTYNINRFKVVRKIRGLRRRISEKLS